MDVGNTGWWVPGLVLGVPPLLLVVLHLLARLERWMAGPDERAAAVTRLLEQEEGPDEIETEVIRLLAQVTQSRRARARRAQRVNGVPSGARRLALRRREPAAVIERPAEPR